MSHPHAVVWFIVALIGGLRMGGLVLTDLWRPQVRGVLAQGWARRWWRGLGACVALNRLGQAWRAWAGAAAVPDWGGILMAVGATVGVVCLLGLVVSPARQQPRA